MATEEILAVPGSSIGSIAHPGNPKRSGMDSGIGLDFSSSSSASFAPDFNAANPVVFPKKSTLDPATSGVEAADGRRKNSSLLSEDDILDLESSDLLLDDDESWLYGAPDINCDKQTQGEESDVISWLRLAAHSLEPASRQALINKLDTIASKKSSSDVSRLDLSKVKEEEEQNSTDEEQWYDTVEGDLDPPGVGGTNGPLSRKDTFKVERRSSREGKVLSSATFTRRSDLRNVVLVSPHSEEASEVSTPDFVKTEEAVMMGKKFQAPPPLIIPPPPKQPPLDARRSSSGSPGGSRTFRRGSASGSAELKELGSREESPNVDMVHPQLHPNLEDIQLLASMQEEDLRQCLEKMQMDRARRRTSSSASVDESAALYHPGARGQLSDPSTTFGNTWTRPTSSAPVGMARPAFPTGGSSPHGGTWGIDLLEKEKEKNRFATYTKKPAGTTGGYQMQRSGSAKTPANRRVTNGYGGQHRTSTPLSDAKNRTYRKPPEVKSSGYGVRRRETTQLTAHTGSSLQKSLPNLSDSRSSEFSLPSGDSMQESVSEKGSYGDLPGTVNGSAQVTQKVKNEENRKCLKPPSASKHPNPRQTGTAKTGIPLPKSSIPQPRTKSPAGRNSPYSVKSQQQKNILPRSGSGTSQHSGNTWKEGCF